MMTAPNHQHLTPYEHFLQHIAHYGAPEYQLQLQESDGDCRAFSGTGQFTQDFTMHFHARELTSGIMAGTFWTDSCHRSP